MAERRKERVVREKVRERGGGEGGRERVRGLEKEGGTEGRREGKEKDGGTVEGVGGRRERGRKCGKLDRKPDRQMEARQTDGERKAGN